MELASSFSEIMSGGGGEVMMKVVPSTTSARPREMVVFCGGGNKTILSITKALRMKVQEQGQQKQKQIWRRLSVRANALASGKEDLRAEPHLSFESSLKEHHHNEESYAVSLVKELREVYASGRTRSAEWREEQMKAMARMMVEREDELVDALRQDLNKPKLETYVSEISQIHDAALDAAKNVRNWMQPEKVPTTSKTFPSKAEIIPEPLGVSLILSAWNYPLLLSLGPVVGAIAAGNVVVLKPSELAPATSATLAKLFPLYLDPLAVRVVEGGIPETTALLEQRWDKILFTGSGRVGKIVLAAAAKHLTPVTLELGGKCPAIVDSTLDMGIAANRIAWGKWSANNGQACIAADYILVEESVAPELLQKLKENIKNFYGDDPSKSSDISRVVNVNHFRRLTGLIDDKDTAEKIVFGGNRDESTLYLSPTIVMNPPLDSPVMQEEIFGPILPIITVKDVSEAIQFMNSRPKPLALYLFTSDKAVQERVLAETSSGAVTVNDCILHVVNKALPFGGVGESGYGAYHGKHSFDTFSHKKGVLVRELWFTGDSEFRCPPYPDSKTQAMKAILTKDWPGLFRALLNLARST
ncbi:unnamed protein product [Calypogeia fissa]